MPDLIKSELRDGDDNKKQISHNNQDYSMKLRLIFIYAIFVFFVSCKKETGSKYTLVTETEMQKILMDMHLTEGIIRTHGSYNNVIYVKRQFYDSILQSHGVTKTQFIWNLLEYSKKKKICELYDKSISELTAQKATYEKEIIKKRNNRK